MTDSTYQPRHRANVQAEDTLAIPSHRLTGPARLLKIADSFEDKALGTRFLADHGIETTEKGRAA